MNDSDTKNQTQATIPQNDQDIKKSDIKPTISNEVISITDISKGEVTIPTPDESIKEVKKDETQIQGRKKKDPNMRGVLTLSFGVAFIFFGFNTAQSFMTPLLGNLGSYSMAIVYLVNALCNFIVPSVIEMFPNERLAMSINGIEYGIYIGTFIYLIPILSVIWSALHGFTSAVLCAVQGIALQSYSTEHDRAFLLLNVLDVGTTTNTTGWLGSSSYLFIILAVSCFIGDIILFFLPKPVKVDASQSIKQKNEKKIPVWKRVKYIWHLMTHSNIKYLLFVFINVGYGAVTVSGQITRHIRDTQYVGIFMCIYSLTDVIWSNICGRLSDKYGSKLIIGTSVVAEIIALVLSYMGNYWNNYIIMYIAAAFFSLEDAAVQTESLVLVGRHFGKQLDEANCIFRMFQCLGGGICFIISPLFVTTDDPVPTVFMFTIELVIAAIVAILSFVFYSIFAHRIHHIQVSSKI